MGFDLMNRELEYSLPLNARPWGPYAGVEDLKERGQELAAMLEPKRSERLVDELCTVHLPRLHFWHALYAINGSLQYQNVFRNPFFGVEENDAALLRNQKRTWARETLSAEERQALFAFSADCAMVYIANSPRPGNRQGNSVLYEHLVMIPDTVFAGTAHDELIRRLHNGRFWETLSNDSLAYHAIDVLKNHAEALDPTLSHLDYHRFEARHSSYCTERVITCMSRGTLQTLEGFIDRVTEVGTVPQNVVEGLRASITKVTRNASDYDDE